MALANLTRAFSATITRSMIPSMGLVPAMARAIPAIATPAIRAMSTDAPSVRSSDEKVFLGYMQHPNVDRVAVVHPRLTQEELETLGEVVHPKVRGIRDFVAWLIIKVSRPVIHGMISSDHCKHACTLETVAGVPGVVGGFIRQLKSLRTSKRDYGWIEQLQEEGENERMHLMSFRQMVKINLFDKFMYRALQFGYTLIYGGLYAVSPYTAHRMIGYLEEGAVKTYTEFLADIDSGKYPNKEIPEVAKYYWNLPEDAKLRDMVLIIRADECWHRDENHHLANLLRKRRKTGDESVLGETRIGVLNEVGFSEM